MAGRQALAGARRCSRRGVLVGASVSGPSLLEQRTIAAGDESKGRGPVNVRASRSRRLRSAPRRPTAGFKQHPHAACRPVRRTCSTRTQSAMICRATTRGSLFRNRAHRRLGMPGSNPIAVQAFSFSRALRARSRSGPRSQPSQGKAKPTLSLSRDRLWKTSPRGVRQQRFRMRVSVSPRATRSTDDVDDPIVEQRDTEREGGGHVEDVRVPQEHVTGVERELGAATPCREGLDRHEDI
jgi:hypothetical protein